MSKHVFFARSHPLFFLSLTLSHSLSRTRTHTHGYAHMHTYIYVYRLRHSLCFTDLCAVNGYRKAIQVKTKCIEILLLVISNLSICQRLYLQVFHSPCVFLSTQLFLSINSYILCVRSVLHKTACDHAIIRQSFRILKVSFLCNRISSKKIHSY